MRIESTRLVLICALVLGVLALSLGASAQDPPTKSANPEWQTYEFGKGSFSALFPDKPTEATQTDKNADIYIYTVVTSWGVLVANYSWLNEEAEKWSEESSHSFYVGFWEGLSSSLNDALEKAGSSNQVKLEEEHKTKFAGRDGWEFSFSIDQQRGRFLVTRVGRQAFSGMIVGTQEGLSEHQEKFFTSFKIKEPTPPNQKP
ncbi:MAG: hypothetical protein M3R68_08775 [Acidobacteriota bacterium]|nr:hypothetical protein [Acidobacteriota bacterium]